LGCSQAGAVVVIGNLPETPGDAIAKLTSTTKWAAVSFTMGGDNYAVNHVKLRLSNYSAAQDTPAIAIFYDSGGNPGSQVGGGLLANPGSTDNAAATFTFAASGLALLRSATYWLVVESAGGNFRWLGEASPGVSPSGIASFGSYKSSANGGSTWSAETDKLTFEIDGTQVPEPQVWGIVASLTLLAFALARAYRFLLAG
jgi:hypothetical protein